MTLGLHWVRRRQRGLARVVLALFCVAWLQAAAVPCAMAEQAGFAAAQQAGVPAVHHDCQYCPPAPASPSGASHHGDCVYPHQAQADARASSGLFFVLPVATPIATLDAIPPDGPARPGNAVPVVPRTRLSLSYCRLLE